MAQRRVAPRHHSLGLPKLLLALIVGGLALALAPGAPLAWTRAAILAQASSHPALAILVFVALTVAGVVASQSRVGSVAGRRRTKPLTKPQAKRPAWRFAPRLARPTSLDALRALTPTQFELAIGDLLRCSGFRSVQHTGGGGDLAADLICRDSQGARVIVQCKRYAASSAVTSPEMQQFIGMIYAHHHADYGLFVTTSTFTQPASALALQHDIRLLDGAALARLWSARMV
jgi:hypothetical protein